MEMHGLSACQKALLQGIPPSADGGINHNPVISGDMCLGNDTSHAGRDDFSARDRVPPCVLAFSKKRLCRFFDSLGFCTTQWYKSNGIVKPSGVRLKTGREEARRRTRSTG